MNFSIIIKQIRNKLFLTQSELAELLSVSFETVNRWENNKNEPNMKTKRKIIQLIKDNNLIIQGINNYD